MGFFLWKTAIKLLRVSMPGFVLHALRWCKMSIIVELFVAQSVFGSGMARL